MKGIDFYNRQAVGPLEKVVWRL